MSEMLEIILDTTGRMFKDYSTQELLESAEQGEWAEELWQVLAESGILHVGIAEKLDGAGGDHIDAYNILRLAGKYAVPLPIAETLIAQWLLAEQGVKPSTVPLSISFENEQEFMIDDLGDRFIVNGKAVYVPWARHAKQLLTLGKLNNESVMVLLPLDKAIIEQGANLASEPRDTVIFENFEITALSCFPVNKNEMVNRVYEMGALARSAKMAGAMEQILELTVFYTNERKQFGRPLHRFQAIQHHLSALTGETVASLAALNFAIHENSTKEIALTKMKLSGAAGKIAEISHQVHGAIGVTHEHTLHHYTRRLWSWRDEFGNERYWGSKLADHLMKNNGETLWEFISAGREANLVYGGEK